MHKAPQPKWCRYLPTSPKIRQLYHLGTSSIVLVGSRNHCHESCVFKNQTLKLKREINSHHFDVTELALRTRLQERFPKGTRNLTDEAPWSMIDDMNRYLSIDVKTRVSYFWSGGIDGLHAKDVAEKCTGNAGPKDLTLGMAMCNTMKFIMPSNKAYDKHPTARKAWEDASDVFAKYAMNIMYTLTGSSSVKSVWLRVELPELRENPDVKAIIQLNKDCGSVCHWQCLNDNSVCKVRLLFPRGWQ